MMETGKARVLCLSSVVFVSFILAALVLMISINANAATFTVINLNDSGAGSLRAAIDQANAAMGPDDIVFAPGLMGTITLGSTLPAITDAAGLTIDGADAITVSGNNAVRVLSVDSGAELTLMNLSIVNGMTPANGGGANNFGTLTVTDSIFSDNEANRGGGIESQGTLTIANSLFQGNNANVDSGGVKNSGTLTVTNSAFVGNTTGGVGGGIGSLETATVVNTTFDGNSAGFDGGGIVNSGTLSVINSTFAGNSSNGNGGGIATGGNAASVATITNCTFEGNSSASGGGGIANFNDGTAELRNTIMANSVVGANCFNFLATLIDGGYNIDDGMTCGFSAVNNSQSNTDALLDPAGLKDNAGPTETIALCDGPGSPSAGCTGISPAIDAIPDMINGCDTAITIDQRTFPRPVDGDGNGSQRCDIGAFESGAIATSDLFIAKGANMNTVRRGKNLTYSILIMNEGPTEATGIIMDDPLPVGTTFVSFYTTDFDSCTSPPPGAGGTLSCHLDTLPSSEAAMVELVVKVTARGGTTITNTAMVEAGEFDPDENNNSASVGTAVFGSRK